MVSGADSDGRNVCDQSNVEYRPIISQRSQRQDYPEVLCRALGYSVV